MAAYLGEPREDPHGHLIPSAQGDIQKRNLQPLDQFRAGQRVIIREVQDDNPARLRRWLQDTNELLLTGLVSIEREASPDGTTEGLKTFYDYAGKVFRHREGTSAMPAVTAWRLPGGETHYEYARYDEFGNVTNSVATYTRSGGSLGSRTNQFIYAENIYTNIVGVLAGTNVIQPQTNTFAVPKMRVW